MHEGVLYLIFLEAGRGEKKKTLVIKKIVIIIPCSVLLAFLEDYAFWAKYILLRSPEQFISIKYSFSL